MQLIISRLSSVLIIDPPHHLLGWIGLVLFLAVLGGALWFWREPFWNRRIRPWQILVTLAMITPLAVLFLGVRLPGDAAVPLPNMPLERGMPTLMFFAALPWVLAAGMVGTIPAVVMGFVSGLLLALAETHSLFTPVELAGMALLFARLVRQRYRTPFYQFLRNPAGGALILALAYAPVFMIGGFFEVNGPLAVRLDFGITQTWPIILARGGELILAGLIAQILVTTRFPLWLRPALLVPSPSEISLNQRFLAATLPLLIGLIFTLMVADWVVAGRAAEAMVHDRLASTAKVAAESLPYFMEAGQNLMKTLATPDLLEMPVERLSESLSGRLRAVPYFHQLFVFDRFLQPVGGYPARQEAELQLTDEERVGIGLALKGVIIQSYVIPPQKGEKTAQVSFLAAIPDSGGRAAGVLLGRTDLNSNPFTQPAIQALASIQEMDGEGIILDETNRMLYNPMPDLVMGDYYGVVPEEARFFNESSPQGTRRFVYTQPVPGRLWKVVLSVPAEEAQQIALQIAIPLLLALVLASLLVFLFLRLSLRWVTASLQSLSMEASSISNGELNNPLVITGEDEVGRLGDAFEKMRISLKGRLDELNRLLLVSQGVASSLDVKTAVQPILESLIAMGASSARMVLQREVAIDSAKDRSSGFGLGTANALYAYLDEQILDLMRHQEQLTISNTARMRRITILPGKPYPAAVMARALYHENTYYGSLWITFDQPHVFADEEVRFFITLSAQAALAAANARLYSNAEVGRRRLEAVLASTPEPVLVTDEQGNLLLLNPAAKEVPGLLTDPTPGKPIREVITAPALHVLLNQQGAERVISQEVPLSGGRMYYASVSPVISEELPVGKICILQNITHFKELDTLKSDFVATVSHDLRNPLTLMRGYATMLQMFGELNDQQKSYILKINQSVENMTRVVGNLLDLGRIEARVDSQFDQVNVREVLEKTIASLQPQAEHKNITLTQDFNLKQSEIVDADAALLHHAFTNLIENAIKYTQLGGQVQIRLSNRANSVLLEVRDNGIGVAPLDLPHVFEKFYRSGRKEAYQQRGTGLGLAIVKSIAERHGGKVWVESTLGKGSSFFLEIPNHQQPNKITAV